MTLIYTSNDEAQNPQIFAVDVESGATVGSFGLNPSLPNGADPEAIRLDVKSGILYLADIGDNNNGRNNIALYGLPEPGPGNHGKLNCTRYLISYPFGPRNAEALAIHPNNGAKYIFTKEAGGARVCRLAPNVSGQAIFVRTLDAPNVTDADFSTNGYWLFVKLQDFQNILVYNALNWQRAGTITCPKVVKGESLTVEVGGKSLLVGSEGINSPLYRVVIPAKFRTTAASTTPPPSTDCNAQVTDPGDILNLSKWKLTLPVNTSAPGEPDEIRQPALNTFENSYFYDMCPKAVVFRAPANGATTGGSSNPRCELREMKAGGSDEIAWNSGSGTHVLDITQAITHLPTRNDNLNPVVAGQIHDAEDDVTVLRCESRNVFTKINGKNVLLCNLWITRGDNTHFKLIANNYILGTYFRIRLVANAAGISYYYDTLKGGGLKFVGRVPGTYKGCYFKAGCYTQANPSNGGKGYGEVRIRALSVSH